MDKLHYIREIVKIFTDSGLTEFKVTDDETQLTVEIKRDKGVSPVVADFDCASSDLPEAGAVAAKACAPEAKEDGVSVGHDVKSPMVGVFYAAPKPGDPPFVNVGDTVKTGDVLCIIEAMKIMNEIKAERSGVIREVCCKDAELVEFGQPIFRME